jgi:hypothetical protein
MQQATFYKRYSFSTTSSARASSGEGIVSPSDFAIFKLMTSWNLIGCWTTRSKGFAPFIFVYIVGSVPVKVTVSNVVGHESAILYCKCSVGVDRGQLVLGREFGHSDALRTKDALCRCEQRLDGGSHSRLERCWNVVGCLDVYDV